MNSLPESWLKFIYQKKFFKLFIPKILKGLELDLKSGLEIILKLSSINASLGWVVNLGAGAGYFCGLFENKTAKEIFNDQKVCIAGSGKIGGRAKRIYDAIKVSGSWDFCTGTSHATHFTSNVQFEDGSINSVLFFHNQVKIEESWNYFALKATSTNRIVVDNAMVDERFIFNYSLQKSFFQYPIYKIPFLTFARCCMLASFIGSSECFVNNTLKEFNLNKSLSNLLKRLKEHINESVKTLLYFSELFYEIAGSDKQIRKETNNEFRKFVLNTNKKISNEMCKLFNLLPMKITKTDSLAHQSWRDFLVISKHFLLK